MGSELASHHSYEDTNSEDAERIRKFRDSMQLSTILDGVAYLQFEGEALNFVRHTYEIDKKIKTVSAVTTVGETKQRETKFPSKDPHFYLILNESAPKKAKSWGRSDKTYQLARVRDNLIAEWQQPFDQVRNSTPYKGK